ncbi:hypothetical protein [Streptomyces sp. KHY 26]|uniref:hypothetical protein n=1 Tax=Streptomyces sp. KHY 26 TaxID=3097359 RepID=UPI00376EBEBF
MLVNQECTGLVKLLEAVVIADSDGRADRRGHSRVAVRRRWGASLPRTRLSSSCNAPARGLTPRDMFPGILLRLAEAAVA